LDHEKANLLSPLDFRKRFLSLLSYKFREFTASTSLNVIDAASAGAKRDASRSLQMSELSMLLTPFDLKRLESYANNTLDYHVVLDLLPTVATLFFDQRLPADVNLSPVQSSILLALGLQRKSIEDISAELPLAVSQALALFIKAVRKLSSSLQSVQRNEVVASMPERDPKDVVRKVVGEDGKTMTAGEWKPVEQTLDEELAEAGSEESRRMKAMQREMIDSLDLSQ
jgi:N-acetyltransferase 10